MVLRMENDILSCSNGNNRNKKTDSLDLSLTINVFFLDLVNNTY